MLKDLLKNNKFEYLYICTNKNQNFVNAMTISYNIANLKYFHVEKDNCKVGITLDVS